MSPKGRNLITGLVVLAAIATFIWMLLQFTGRATAAFAHKGIPVVIVATRGDGISEGTAVLYHGISVGKVERLSRDPDNIHILINAQVQNTPPLPADLKAAIRMSSMLGNASLIDLESVGLPTGELTANQRIPATYVGSQIVPPEFTDLLNDVRQQKLIQHTDEAIIALHEQLDRAGKVMASVQDIVGDPKLQSDIRSAVANMRAVSERADRIGGNLEKFTTDLQKVSANANDTIVSMHKTIDRTGTDVDALARHLTDDVDKMGRVLDQFQQVAAKINNGRGTAGQLLNDPVLYDELTDTARELNVVAKSIHRLIDQWEQEGLSLKVK